MTRAGNTFPSSAIRRTEKALSRMSSLCLLVALTPAGSRFSSDADSVRAILGGAKQQHVADQLAKLGPSALPELFQVLRERSIAGASDDREEAPGSELTPQQSEAVLHAFGKLPRQALEFLQKLELEQEDTAGRIAALEILGACGGKANLELTLTTAGATEDYNPPRQVLIALERAIQEILLRDPEAFIEVERLIQHAAPASQFCLARALGSTQNARSLDILTRCLRRSTLGDVFLLTQIGRCLAGPKSWDTEQLLLKVRPLLTSLDPVLQREAALVIGRSIDFESFEELIDLLASEHAGVRDGAHWALMQISGASYRADPERWRGWLAAERSWWERDSVRAFSLLRSPREVEVAAAINSIAQRRYKNDVLARELLAAVGHKNPKVSALACKGLVAIGSKRVVPELIELLADPDENVREHIGSALQELTGLELDPVREVWRQKAL